MMGPLLVAALVMVALVTFAACDKSKGGSGRRGQTAIKWSGPEPRDLGGLVFKIADFHSDRFMPGDGEVGTPIGEMKALVMKSIEDDFNIKFEIIDVAPAEMIYRLFNAVYAGDLFAHMVITTQWAYGDLIGAELLGDLAAIPTLNLDDGLWNKAVNKATNIGGKVLATAGIYEFWGLTWVTYYQKSLWKELNLPDPYELVRKGEWTWERLLEYSIIAQQDLTGDGVVDGPNDRWGLVSPGDDLLRAWYTSMGGLYFDYNPATGRLYSPAATLDGIAIADWMRDFTDVPGVWYGAHGQTDDVRTEMFINRRALFNMGGLAVPGAFREMNDDFGILPMPKRNARQAAYLNNVNHNAALIGISKTNNQLEETGIIMEAMAARFAPVRDLQREELVDIMLRSDEDVEMLDYIIDHTVFDIGHILFRASEGGTGFNVPHARITDYVTMHAIGDFASAMEANRDAMELAANELFFGQ
jgi:hypothetical protein